MLRNTRSLITSIWNRVNEKPLVNRSVRSKSSLNALRQGPRRDNQEKKNQANSSEKPTFPHVSNQPRFNMRPLEFELNELSRAKPSERLRRCPKLIEELEHALNVCESSEKDQISKILSRAYTLNARVISVTASQRDANLAIEQLNKAIILDRSNIEADHILQEIFLTMGKPSKLGELFFQGRPGDQWEHLEKGLDPKDQSSFNA